jgi:LmbE family N-acetylglucosaminyl deacetylase
MSEPTLLGVWAHPDDEAYLSAGLMAQARHRGDRVVVVTATAGERGTDDPERWPPDRLATWRRRELRASLATVGVFEHHFLGYRDGECERVDGTSRIAALIREIRPDTIVTFGPEGMTGHPDHRAVSAWVTAAWRIAESDAALWYATLTPDFHAEWGELNDHFGLWAAIDQPPCIEVADLAYTVELVGRARDQKLAALAAQRTQTAGLLDAVGPETYRRWWSREFFVEAATHARVRAERMEWTGHPCGG